MHARLWLTMVAVVALAMSGCHRKPETADPTARFCGTYQFPNGALLAVQPEGKAQIVGTAGKQDLTWQQSGAALVLEGQGGGTLACPEGRQPTFTPAAGGTAWPLRRRQ